MSLTRLLIRNLQYYRKSWLSILAGTVLSTAVLTGALIVGDSVRYSLGRQAVTRLGTIHYSIQPGDRFFRQQLACIGINLCYFSFSNLLILRSSRAT